MVLLGKVLPIVAAEAGVRRSRYSESDKVYYVKSLEVSAIFPWQSKYPDLGSHFCQSKKFSNVLVVEPNTAV